MVIPMTPETAWNILALVISRAPLNAAEVFAVQEAVRVIAQQLDAKKAAP